MAKGSLMGKADSTLVSSAFRLGESNTAYNLGGIYQQRAANFKEFAKATQDFMNNLYADHIDTENKMGILAESITEGGGLTNPYMIEQNNAVVNGFKDRLKRIPKTKKGELERQLLLGEMSDYAESLNSSNEMYNGMVANATNKRLLSSYNSDEKKLFTRIMEDHIEGTDRTQPTYDPKSHQMVYSMENEKGETITMSMADINRGLSAYDPKYLENIASKFTSVVAISKASPNKEMTLDDAIRFKNDLNKSINSMDEVRNVAKERFGNMKYSFEEVLNGQAKDANGNPDMTFLGILYDELDAIGGVDMDGDGDVDEKDKKQYTNPENAAILMGALNNDKDKYKELMTGYLTETVIKDYYWQQGVEQRPTSEVDYNELLRKAKYEDYIKNRNNPLANYQNRTVEFDLFTKVDGEDQSLKTKTTSDELINLDNQLSNLMGESSFDTENYVDIFGTRIGYFPGKGFAPVRVANKGDIGTVIGRDGKTTTRKTRAGEILRDDPKAGYFKTPRDVFRHYSIPTTYNMDKRVIGKDGKVYEKVEGGYKLVN